jgi:ABC-type transporter Mla subunit MlaD
MAGRNDRNAFKAGLFIIISLFLIIALILGIKGIGRFVVRTQDRMVRFALSDDIGGLSPGDSLPIHPPIHPPGRLKRRRPGS